MRLLLQNKISSLEKQNVLWETAGDEKIGIAIASLLNAMYELATLAKKFELLEELYYGGCFEKILGLLGHTRERKFISKCNDPNEEACGMGTPCRIPPERTGSTKTIYHSGKKQKMFGY